VLIVVQSLHHKIESSNAAPRFRCVASCAQQLVRLHGCSTFAADEPVEQNFVRNHALAQTSELSINMDEAAMPVFVNASGNYGTNNNQLVELSAWNKDQQLIGRSVRSCGQGLK
jgi:hypothetical protein